MAQRYPLVAGERATADFEAASISHANCLVCDQPARGHLKCAECGVLVGPGHLDVALADGEHCGTCTRWLAKRRVKR